MGRLQDKVAMVIGAGSSGPGWGNGKAAAVSYAREGARVIAVDVDLDRAEETCKIIKEEGGEAVAVKADVTKSAEVKIAVDKTVELFDTIDILHYNAGIGIFGNPEDLSEEKWDLIFDINVKGAFLFCKHVLPVMKRKQSGVITTISSIAGIVVGSYPYIAYYASKAGLNHFTKAIAVAYAGDGIRANSLLPGAMNTPMLYSQEDMMDHYGGAEEMVKARDALTPMGKMGDAWDVANAAVFLASDEAKYISGVILPVDGCLSCKIG